MMKEQIMKGFREIAASLGYPPEAVYASGDRIVLPKELSDKVKAALDRLERSSRAST